MTTASPRRNTRKALGGVVFYALLAVVLIPFLFVFWYMITTSLKSPQDLTASTFRWFFTPTLDNYAQVFQQTDFAQFAMNSLLVGLGSVAIALVLGLPAAYAIARYQAPKLALIILSSRITPGVTFLIPLFIIFSGLGWVDTYRALIIAHLLITLPMVTWLMIGFFEELPQEIIDSARVDGASAIRTFLQVILPITRGGIAAAAILAFIFSWNHFMFSVVLAGRTTRTLPVAVFEFMSYGQINWGAICAAATVMTIPVVVMGLFAQRNIVQGLAGGAVKG
ncbi:carbohydrate ABC transporter permease [Microbacterium pseudoresistens]|uniref:Multiple sugar transport system permease protein n=1 Tax=Microbacterium pseudoresistens TaxID=640634 RepID=A0A7Y9JMN8_9MICO|nr:carbohydrate ABC transporter permease [Microbacterium pseudoresistens]NYD54231.1 multiple sugar transport system permease protein [Microbacterium pseudoresistens]